MPRWHVRAVHEICGEPPRQQEGLLRLWAGLNDHHLQADEDDPGHPWHLYQLR